MPQFKILYENDNCIIVEKPQGLDSEETGKKCLPLLLKEYLSTQNTAPQDTGSEIFPVHRLDRPTGGAIIYAKNAAAAAELCRSIAERRLEKRYLAVLCGKPEEEYGSLCDLLYHDKRQNKVFVVKSERRGAKKALLNYRLISTVEYDGIPLTLVEVELLTGRTHQIRAQFSSRKLPILGDRRYGCRQGLHGGAIALWSHSLTLIPPTSTGARAAVSVVSVPPREFPWSLFNELDDQRQASDL